MGKREKEHRKKVKSRNIKIKQESDRNKKEQRRLLMDLINQEKNKGMFENNQSISSMDLPKIDSIIEGPSI